MDAREKILHIEADKRMLAFMAALLSGDDYSVIQADSGEEGIHMTASHIPDLILMELALPDMEGIGVLERIREWSDVPVIVVSVRQREQDKVKALDSGANDYVTKPFGGDELLARIRSALRVHRRAQGGRRQSVFRSGGLVIDYEKRMVWVEGKPVHLTPMEYKIAVLLSQNAGKVLTHDQILGQLWGPYAKESQMLRVNVANIRRKIEKIPASPRYILTEAGVGYRMAEIGEGA